MNDQPGKDRQHLEESLAACMTELAKANEWLRDEIAARKRAQQEYHAIIAVAMDGFWIADTEGRFLDVNEAYCRLTGYSREELLTMRIPDIEAVEQPEDTARHIRQVIATGSDRFETRHRCKDGKIVDIEISVNHLPGDRGRLFVFARDITERKRAENELRRYAAQLEAANKELEAFSYSVSHDLRTPLRAIDGFSRILLEDYQDRLDDEGKRLLNVVRNNTARMARLIDDILAFSRTGRLEMAEAEVDIEELARVAWEEFEPAAAGRRLELDIQPLPPAWGDRAMLRQVLVNLLSNAVKFTRPKEVARIEVGGAVDGKEIVYHVKDNGVGFDMQYANKLFGVFQRLHGVEEFEGTGIGLAIVKRIVARHGGRVWAEGRVNEGATFYFALPAKEGGHD